MFDAVFSHNLFKVFDASVTVQAPIQEGPAVVFITHHAALSILWISFAFQFIALYWSSRMYSCLQVLSLSLGSLPQSAPV